MAGRGGAIPGNGRKKKADEQRIRDLTSPYVGDAVAKVVAIMNNAEKESDQLAAAKLLLAYHFGQPSQSVDLSSVGETLRMNIIVDNETKP
jgi:hypothetical protein